MARCSIMPVRLQRRRQPPRAARTAHGQRKHVQFELGSLRELEENTLEAFRTEQKGRGVRSCVCIPKGSAVCEYAGDLLCGREGKALFDMYEEEYGSYIFFFQYCNRSYCIDATHDDGRLGRLINHSRLHPNIRPKALIVHGKLKVIFFALRNIPVSEELLFDYGDRSQTSIMHHPWLAN